MSEIEDQLRKLLLPLDLIHLGKVISFSPNIIDLLCLANFLGVDEDLINFKSLPNYWIDLEFEPSFINILDQIHFHAKFQPNYDGIPEIIPEFRILEE